MSDTTTPACCPHCGSILQKWIIPPQSTWCSDYFLVCFNNECSYYRRGWDHIQASVNARASYRYSIDPATGHKQPLPVWSDDALRDSICDENEQA